MGGVELRVHRGQARDQLGAGLAHRLAHRLLHGALQIRRRGLRLVEDGRHRHLSARTVALDGLMTALALHCPLTEDLPLTYLDLVDAVVLHVDDALVHVVHLAHQLVLGAAVLVVVGRHGLGGHGSMSSGLSLQDGEGDLSGLTSVSLSKRRSSIESSSPIRRSTLLSRSPRRRSSVSRR